MKPESHAWLHLQEHAAAQLRPGFAARTLRAARTPDGLATPAILSQFAYSAAAATVCLLLVVFVHTRSAQAESARNLAHWEAIAAEAQNFAQLP